MIHCTNKRRSFISSQFTNRHAAEFSELTTDERAALIRAMNHLKAVVSLFPSISLSPEFGQKNARRVYAIYLLRVN
jgi:hypothetical protein